MKLSKKQFELAKKIWGTQIKYPRTKFNPSDFTATGKLTKTGLKKLRKK